jgi:hypothetical protein
MISELFMILDLFIIELTKLLSLVTWGKKNILTKLGAVSWSFA